LRRQQLSERIYKFCGYQAAYRVAEKEGLLGGLRWALARQILVGVRNAGQEDRFGKEPA